MLGLHHTTVTVALAVANAAVWLDVAVKITGH